MNLLLLWTEPAVTMVSRPITQHFFRSQFKMLTIKYTVLFSAIHQSPCCHGDRSIFRNVTSTLSSIALLPKHSFAAKIEFPD